jgi:hypothetical protein
MALTIVGWLPLARGGEKGGAHFSAPKPPQVSMPHYNPPKMPHFTPPPMPHMGFSLPVAQHMHNMSVQQHAIHPPKLATASEVGPKATHITMHAPKVTGTHVHTTKSNSSSQASMGGVVPHPGAGSYSAGSGYHHYYSGNHYYSGRSAYNHRYYFRPRRYYLYSNRYNSSQKHLAQLIADLDALQPKRVVTQVQKNILKIDLERVVEGGGYHPNASNVQQLANDLTDAMTGRRDPVINTQELALALKAVMNSSRVGPEVVNQAIAESRGLLKGAIANDLHVQNVVGDLRTISGLARGGLAMPAGLH